MAVQWAAEQLTRFLSALSTTTDSAEMLRRAVDLAADALEAEVTAFVADGAVGPVVGYPASSVPAAALATLAAQSGGIGQLPDLGACYFHVGSLDDPRLGRLLVARLGDRPFNDDDRTLLRGMARVLGLSLRTTQQLLDERDRRSDSEREAGRYRDLVSSLEERRSLLERLTRIQRSITGGAPLGTVLDGIVTGARELLHLDVVSLRRVDPARPDLAVVVASCGDDLDDPIIPRVLTLDDAESLSCRAMNTGTLVVDDVDNRIGLTAGMSAPVTENAKIIGCLTVASRVPGRRFSVAEQEILSSFASHASLAISEATTAEALRHALDAARHDALHDVLTGLANRALLRDRLDVATARAQRHPQKLALIFLDLDNFKHVNDSLGHDAGDELLVAVARRLSASVRPSDLIARLGGDEFAVLVEDVRRDGEADELAERLSLALAEPVSVLDRTVEVSASVGIALWDGDGEAHSLLSNADLAMYEAKRAGGSRFVRFEPGMHERTVARMDIEHDLRRAIGTDEIVVHYQPLVDVCTGRIVAAEALVRWQHPERGLVPPVEFIAIAESSRLIRALGEQVLGIATRQAATWPEGIGLSVNLSPRQITHELPGQITRALADAGLAASRLTAEVTESIVMAETPESIDVLAELRELGVHIAIDDFGTGYSSLARLRTLPADRLKIDRRFVKDLDTSEGVAVIGAILALGRAAGLATVAEGVETVLELEALTSLGCNLAQGYLLARPVPAEDFEALLTRQSLLPMRDVGPATGSPGSGSGHADSDVPSYPADVLVFRRVGPDRFAHIGGLGRGEGWAGIVEVTVGADTNLPVGIGQVLRRTATMPVQVMGPYWAADAAVVRVDDDTVVVLGDPSLSLATVADSEVAALALRHARAVAAATPAKRLSDELELLNAVRDVTTGVSSSMHEALLHLASVAMEALSCELAVVVVDDGQHAVVQKGFAVSAAPDQIASAVLQVPVDAGMVCTQNALRAPLPPPLVAGVVSWSAVPIVGTVSGTLLVAHTEARPRGFTSLCQRLVVEIARAAQVPLHVAALRESISGNRAAMWAAESIPRPRSVVGADDPGLLALETIQDGSAYETP